MKFYSAYISLVYFVHYHRRRKHRGHVSPSKFLASLYFHFCLVLIIVCIDITFGFALRPPIYNIIHKSNCVPPLIIIN